MPWSRRTSTTMEADTGNKIVLGLLGPLCMLALNGLSFHT